jgi:hypothetical protein
LAMPAPAARKSGCGRMGAIATNPRCRNLEISGLIARLGTSMAKRWWLPPGRIEALSTCFVNVAGYFSAGDLSPDGKTVALVSTKGLLSFFDTEDLSRKVREDFKISHGANVATRAFYVRYSQDGTELAVTASFGTKSFVILNMATGEREIEVPPGLSIVRIGFGPANAEAPFICVSMAGQLEIFQDRETNRPAFQPIVIPTAVAILPSIAPDAKRMLTISGPSVTSLDTMRVWSLRLAKNSNIDQISNADAPVWLADAADYVAARSSDDGFQAPVTLSEIRKNHAESPGNPAYAEIWTRLFGKK